jgi:hypothetical protein
MTTSHALVFSGTRWKTARLVSAGSTVFEVAASGHGRKWQTNIALGFWRDFPSLPLANADAVVAFVKRYGDPFGYLDRGEVMHTGHWKNLQALLGTAANAWKAPGPDGVSRISADPRRRQLAEWFLRDDPMPLVKEVEPMFDPNGAPRVVLRAKSLATFMCLSALASVDRHVPMRRCAHCGSWFEVTRVDARFCSSSCRSFHSQQKE